MNFAFARVRIHGDSDVVLLSRNIFANEVIVHKIDLIRSMYGKYKIKIIKKGTISVKKYY